MFRVTGLKNLSRVGTHIFLGGGGGGGGRGGYIILCILKGTSPFKMHKIIYFFPENLKNSRFHH